MFQHHINHILTRISPSSSLTSKVANGLGSPFPIKGISGKPGAQSPLTSPVARSNSVLCAGHSMHPSLTCRMAHRKCPDVHLTRNKSYSHLHVLSSQSSCHRKANSWASYHNRIQSHPPVRYTHAGDYPPQMIIY